MADVSLKGNLQGGIVGIGGETTGYALNNARLASDSIEIDMSAINNVGTLDGKEITVVGEFVIISYLERGDVLVFKAKAAKESHS